MKLEMAWASEKYLPSRLLSVTALVCHSMRHTLMPLLFSPCSVDAALQRDLPGSPGQLCEIAQAEDAAMRGCAANSTCFPLPEMVRWKQQLQYC